MIQYMVERSKVKVTSPLYAMTENQTCLWNRKAHHEFGRPIQTECDNPSARCAVT